MGTTCARLVGLLLATLACQLGVAAAASASAAEQQATPVAAPISADPSGPARGTMIMIHAGGWAGHDAHAQSLLMDRPGALLVAHGWRVVSLDYDEGTPGLQDVLDAAGAELTRGTGSGPLCLYGESSGAHLALVAASRLRAIDCVIGLGVPTDLMLYEADAGDDVQRQIVSDQMRRFFGSTAAEVAPWDLVALAPAIHADVLLIHEADDTVVPTVNNERFVAARPTTENIELEAGDPSDPSTSFVHGHVSRAGQDFYAQQVAAFADRAVASSEAERSAARMGCPRVNRSVAELGRSGLRDALLCLARKDAGTPQTGPGSWRRTAISMRGEANAARLWAGLRATEAGRTALAAAARDRAKVIVKSAGATKVVIRAKR